MNLKIGVCLLLLVSATFTTSAQSKVTATNIVGKWKPIVYKLDSSLRYDLETDSLFLANRMLKDLQAQAKKDKLSFDTLRKMIKHSISKNIQAKTFVFTVEGKEIIKIQDTKDEIDTYTLNESSDTTLIKFGKSDKRDIKKNIL
jgi:hypothetical protein